MNKRCDKDVVDVHVAPFRISATIMTKLVYSLFNFGCLIVSRRHYNILYTPRNQHLSIIFSLLTCPIIWENAGSSHCF